MAVYSHSKISTFEQCPKKYKFRYIDKIIIIEKTIEAFLGKIVHKTLEWLYLEVKENKIPTIEEIIIHYDKQWKEKYDEKIIIVNNNLSTGDYYNKGIQFLINYYLSHKPFDDNTLEVEKEIWINLDENGEYKIKGFIDRLVYNLETGEYEIHDYKTSNSMPNPEKIENDRQLALYSMAIKNLYGHDKEVLLVWHYLAYNKKVRSKKTNEQLKELKKQIIELIKNIETEEKFPCHISRLCDWCEYKKICPAWENSPKNYKKEIQEIQKEIKDFDEIEREKEQEDELDIFD